MDTYMELSKKTTILFTEHQHALLARLAQIRGSSIGALVRDACESVYGQISPEERVESARALADLALPIDDVGTMKAQSVVSPADLLPGR